MSEFSVTFLVLVNSKSGGQDGPHLLEKFTEIFREVSSFTPHWAPLRMRLSILREILSLRCINFKNLCTHHQEEVLRIPKHPQLAKFGLF